MLQIKKGSRCMNKHSIILILCISFLLPYNTLHAFGTRINDPKIPASPWAGKIPLELTGFVKLDGFIDSRQVYTDEDNNNLVLPQQKRIDPVGRDINHQGQFNMIGLETRLRLDIYGLDIGCAHSNAAIEGDFVGVPTIFSDVPSVINAYRIRHAYAAVGIPQLTFLAGHYWHPMIAPECAPDQLAVDAGTPFAIEAHVPQTRCTIHLTPHIDMAITIASQLGFTNNGPFGFSQRYARNSVTPNINIRFDAKSNDNNIIGTSFDFKRLRPRIESNTGYKVNEIFPSIAGTIFGSYLFNDIFQIKMAVNAGQNMTNFRILSGYAVHSIAPVTDERTYTNLSTVATWGELIFDGCWVEPALFIGWVKNLGASKTIIPETIDPDGNVENLIYGLIPGNVDTAFRAAPRIRFFFDPLTVGVEGEYTRAGYGILEPFGTVNPTMPVFDFRFTLSFFYYF